MNKRQWKTLLYSFVGLIGIALIVAAFILQKRTGEGLVKYVNNKDNFQMKYPKSWKKYEGKDGTAFMVISPKEGELDLFTESVNIVVQDLRENPIDLEVYNDLAVKQMQVMFGKNMYILETTSEVQLSGLPAYRFRYRGSTNTTFEIYALHMWTIKNDKAYQFTYMALYPPEEDKFYPMIEDMIKSFKLI